MGRPKKSKKSGRYDSRNSSEYDTVINFDSYDKRTISIFEVLGSYFVDLYFNHIYASSKLNIINSNGNSITDEYKAQVQAYMTNVKGDHSCYTDTINKLYNYYKNTTSYKTITFNTFIDHIVFEIIPVDYFESCTTKEKDEMLGNAIYDLISGLGVYVTSIDILPKIIDHHDQPEYTVRLIQDYAVTLLLTKRDFIHNQFIKNSNNVKDQVSHDLVDRMNKQIVRLVKEKSNLIYDHDALLKKYDRLEDELFHYKKLEVRLKKTVEQLMAENISLKKKSKGKKKVESSSESEEYSAESESDVSRSPSIAKKKKVKKTKKNNKKVKATKAKSVSEHSDSNVSEQQGSHDSQPQSSTPQESIINTDILSELGIDMEKRNKLRERFSRMNSEPESE
jgi:hypothetical protein